MKLLRLALFNIRKHKIESGSLFLLLVICMNLIATSISGLHATTQIFDNAFRRTECIPGFVYMDMDEYKKIYIDFFDDDPRIKRFVEIDASISYKAKFINEDGKKRTFCSVFVTEEGDAKMEKLLLDSPLTREEIYAKEHFALLPFYAQNTLGYKVGDTFEVFCDDKVFPFEIAGFYESGYYAGNSEMKMIVSPADLARMQKFFGESKIIGYEMNDPDQEEQFLADFYDFADENAVGTETLLISYKHINYDDEKLFRLNTMDVFTRLIIGMSIVLFISIAFMIMFRIKNDIDEQMVSIGVLEALGYKSGEISLSYVMEYLLIAVPAVVTALLLSLLTTPVIVKIGERLIGHKNYGATIISGLPIKIGLLLILMVTFISLWRSLRIRKLPPVVAFRKGTEDHSFRRNLLSLEKTKSNVHFRLAAKSFLAKFWSNIGMSLCISISVIALMVCFVLNGIAHKGMDAMIPMMGCEVSDISILPSPGTDVTEMAEEIKGMDGVKNVTLINNGSENEAVVENEYLDELFYILVYEDYDSLKNVHLSEGRVPKHDNECMMHKTVLKEIGKSLGDTITVSKGRIKQDYIICGVVDAVFYLQNYVYLTPEGYRRIEPAYSPDQIEVFLDNRDDRDAFQLKLIERFGAPAYGFSGGDDEGDLEARIRAKADEKMGLLLDMYGVDHMDYAIQIDDIVIKGDSSRFRIKAFTNLTDFIETALDPIIYALITGTDIFMALSVLVISLIILLLISSAVRGQRHEFGVMKGMGYSSKELMFQTAVKIVPVMLVSVVLGSVAGITIAGYIYSKYGELPAVTGKVVFLGACIVVFGYAVAYFSARKIKNISVYELMQE